MTNSLDRRSFLAALPGVAALPGLAALPGVAAPLDRAPPPGPSAPGRPAERAGTRRPAEGPGTVALTAVGVQLYTLRDVLPGDVDGVLATLAEIGYREVELAGLAGLAAGEMRAKLDAVGLVAASSHHSVEELRGDWARVLADARTLGQRLVVIPSIPGGERDAESLRRLAAEFNRAGEQARDAGMRLGYHNHDWELAPLADGTRPMDLLLSRTEPDLVDWQMDIFWTVHGGADPARYLREHAGRVTSVHVKDRTADGRMVDVGAGIIDWAGLLPLAERLGMRHAFVEHDRPEDSVASVRRSFAHLRSLGHGPP